ncbi:MAG: T9SS type A sorting domain-containing protein, partial [Crocinitomicaceae bacterium]
SPYQKKTMNTERFARPVNTGVNHTLLILGSAWETSPELGDEIAVYDSENNMVASVAWRPEQEGHSGLAIWGDDETTSAKEGMLKGETFSIVLFDKSEDAMTALKVNRWELGDNAFAKDGVSVVGSIASSSVIAQDLELFQNVPNPVQDNTSISFYLPKDGKINLTVSNTLGQEVMVLSKENFTKGMHTVQMDANSLSTGVYFYKLEANKNSLTKQLTLVN